MQPFVHNQVLNSMIPIGQHLGSPMFQHKVHSSNANTLSGHANILEVNDIIQNDRGSSLDAATREFMELRFNFDFSKVRIHTSVKASESAQAIGASAYTVGPHIIFSPNQYSSQSSIGIRLLAHELAHVVQQKQMNENRKDYFMTIFRGERMIIQSFLGKGESEKIFSDIIFC